jgi:hypothetical protein
VLHTSAMARTSPNSFWDRLEEASNDVGLPYGLSDIGRELDLWPSAVQKWKDGTALPAQKNLIALAQNRGINTEWLLTGRGPKLSESHMDAATRELLAIWTKLDGEAQKRLLSAAQYEKKVAPQPAVAEEITRDKLPARVAPFPAKKPR